MKQYISPEQLNELSDEGKRKLKEYQDFNYMGKIPSSERKLLALSIGEMIEFLDTNLEVVNISKYVEKDAPADNNIWWNGCIAKIFTWSSVSYYKAEELCDALWKAVKLVLEDEL